MESPKIIYEPIPTPHNIDYAFQRLLFALVESANYKEYENSKSDYEKILQIVIKWISDYINHNEILNIDEKEFYFIKEQLYHLDNMYLSSDGLYAEESYEWMIQLEILITKQNKKEADSDGK